jgi:AcrR family transcriptional regulator
MPRPSQISRKRQELLPIVARAFAELGYRRATTAELARRCGVPQNILYRIWPDKKAMFIAAIDYVYELSAATWQRLLDAGHN